jgi:hypothetical protein
MVDAVRGAEDLWAGHSRGQHQQPDRSTAAHDHRFLDPELADAVGVDLGPVAVGQAGSAAPDAILGGVDSLSLQHRAGQADELVGGRWPDKTRCGSGPGSYNWSGRLVRPDTTPAPRPTESTDAPEDPYGRTDVVVPPSSPPIPTVGTTPDH